MAIFRVEQTVIDKIWDHSNADRLELASVAGIDLQFVIGKGVYQIDMPVVYFPIDSLIPPALIEHLDLGGRLAGKKQNRIKTMKLRKQISQGFVCPVSVIKEYLGDDYPTDGEIDNERLTKALGVIKYEPPEIACQSGTLIPLPDGVSMYDIEGVERYGDVVEKLMDIPCMITEKIEGTNWSLTIDPDNQIHVGQRNHSIREDETCINDQQNTYWKAARNGKLIDLAKWIKRNTDSKQVTLRGEMIGPGIQGNYYNFKTHTVLIFDMMIDHKYVNADEVFDCVTCDVHVPVLSNHMTLREWLAGRSITDASNSKSVLVDRLREGIVIKPCIEFHDMNGLGRVILKKRSPEYLAKTDH